MDTGLSNTVSLFVSKISEYDSSAVFTWQFMIKILSTWNKKLPKQLSIGRLLPQTFPPNDPAGSYEGKRSLWGKGVGLGWEGDEYIHNSYNSVDNEAYNFCSDENHLLQIDIN